MNGPLFGRATLAFVWIGAAMWMGASAFPAAAQTAAPPAAPPVSSPRVDWIVDVRVRDEIVDQDGFARNAQAITARARLGVDAAITDHLRVLFEVEGVGHLDDRFNDTVNGRTRFPVVSDPEALEINRAQVSWTGLPGTEVTLGRQRVVLDNARFVGNGAWRQNEQTFDAARIVTTRLKPITLTYLYLDQVRRSLGPKSPDGRWNSDSHLFHADAKTAVGQLAAYAYLIDLPSAPTQSSETFGARLVGARPLHAGLEATYAVEYAHQQDYGSNPQHFGLDYLAADGGVKGANWSVAAGVERLGGDGVTGFLTPLASFHGFQGWSDAITATPPGGLLDLNMRGTVRWPRVPIGDGLRFAAAAYRFTRPDDGHRYGGEFDASVATALNDHVSVELKTALFDGHDRSFADRDKLWLTCDLKF